MPDSSSFGSSDHTDAKRAAPEKRSAVRYYPGRDVSVQFGGSPPRANTSPELRVRIIILIDFSGTYVEANPPKVQVPEIIVIPSKGSEILMGDSAERVVILFIEQRYVCETAWLAITGVTRKYVSELAEKDLLAVSLIDRLRSISLRKRYPNAHYIEALGTVTAAHVLQNFFGDRTLADGRSGLPANARQRVVSYIDEHYAEEYDVGALARVSGYSRNHFQRLFKKSFEQTPRDYVRGCQVQQAITLLQTTTLKGLDVALACGFCDETQMARWFVRLRRCLPSAVRKTAGW